MPHNAIHKPFLNAHRALVQTQLETEHGYTGLVPLIRGDVKSPVPALLHGEWLRVAGLGELPDGQDPRFEPAARLHLNLARMFLYLMRDKLAAGAPVTRKSDLVAQVGRWAKASQTVGMRLADAAFAQKVPALAADRSHLVEGTNALANELTQRLRAAPEQPSPGP